MQEVIVNVLFIAVLVVLAGTLFFDVRKEAQSHEDSRA